MQRSSIALLKNCVGVDTSFEVTHLTTCYPQTVYESFIWNLIDMQNDDNKNF